ncbi:MAG TPA: gliding motility-associated C-terminal domain-containing protein, partial [Chitinophaga sp.]|nr:gliding motility-associated C-terminal domain-containing protein [Chitinophaga sp.]
LLIIQMKGAVIDSTNTNAFGTIKDYKSAGNYEFNYVKSKNGNIIELLNTLTRAYNIPNGKVQIVRVPYYDNAVVSSSLTCLPWDGKKGGILVLRAKKGIQLNADIDVSGKGFRGGSSGNNLTHASNCSQLAYSYPLGNNFGAPKGEGIAILSNNHLSGRGALANGGGGGDDHNSGGGGGSNGSPGGKGGYQFENCGSGSFDNGGLGGKQLTYSNPANKVFLGGGGGSGHANNQAGFNPDGGNGGGIIIIDAPFINNNGNFSIKADGGHAVTCSSNSNNDNCNEGMGGGGAGGSILINTSSYTNNIILSVKGGNGADVSYYEPAAPNSKHGPGGGGSGGAIWINQSAIPGNLTLDIIAGKNGRNINYGNDVWGSISGQNGISINNLQLPADGGPFTGLNTVLHDFDFTFSQDICNPKQVTFTTNTNEIVNWDLGNGTLIGDVKTHDELYADYGIYTVKLRVTYNNGCRDSVIKQAPIQLTIDSTITTRDTTICGTTSFQLKALPALQYCWSPATGLSATDIPSPVISNFIPATTYYLNALTQGPNLIKNGDFSQGNTEFTSDYIYSPSSGFNTGVYSVTSNLPLWHPQMPACGDKTTGAGNMMTVNGSEAIDVKVWSQTISIQPNTNYAFSTWLQHITTVNPAQLQFSINGVQLGDIFVASSQSCLWKQFYTVWNSGTNTTATISIINKNTIPNGNDFALDDISFSALRMLRDSVTIGIYDKPEIDYNYTIPFCKSLQLNEIALNEPHPIQHWDWYFGDNTSASSLSPFHSYAKGGTYNIKLLATDINGCKDSTTKTIQLDTATAIATYSGPVCPGGTVTLQGSGGTQYEWSPTSSVDNPGNQNTTATLTTNTKFQLKVTDNIGCEDTASVFASVIPKPAFSKPADMQTCKGNSMVLNANGNPSYQYTWSPADYLNDPNVASPVATPDVSTEYTVHVIEPQCGYDTSFTIKTIISANANVFVLPNAFTPNGDGKNDCFGIRNWGSTTIHEFSIYNRWGQKVFETKNPSNCWDGKYKGQLQPSGAYIYMIKALTPCGEVERRGSFMLVR